MYFGYIEGYSITDDIHYCPSCGADILTAHADGTMTCDVCGERFAVITVNQED